MSNASSLYMDQLAGKKTILNNKAINFSRNKIHFYNLISLTYSYKEIHPPPDK